jgi:hypothetical protein
LNGVEAARKKEDSDFCHSFTSGNRGMVFMEKGGTYMTRLEKRIKQEEEEWNRKAYGQKRTMIIEKSSSLSVQNRLQTIVGGYVIGCFPELLELQPKPTEQENDVEFAPVKRFLELLVKDKGYVENLIAKAKEICA